MKPELEQRMRVEIEKGRTPREVIREMLANGSIKNPKQAWRTLEKWGARGEYEYGVSADMGWLVKSLNVPPERVSSLPDKMPEVITSPACPPDKVYMVARNKEGRVIDAVKMEMEGAERDGA